MRWREWVMAVRGRVAVVAALALAACSASGGTGLRASMPELVGALSQPSITISGLPAGARVQVRLTSTDVKGTRWSSTVSVTASRAGRLVASSGLTATPGRLPLARLWAMMPRPLTAGAYFWCWPCRQSFQLSVRRAGQTLATATLARSLTPQPYRTRWATLAADGFIGEFFPAAGPVRHRRGVLLIGGSRGRIADPVIAAALAGRGYPTLSVAYFGYPGLPAALADIPIEYFATAVRWLERQPGVDPAAVDVIGGSRGSEAAELLGAFEPALVHALVADVPSDVALCSYPGCDGPAWTWQGHPVPYTRQFDTPHPTDDPAAVIPVRRIRGPVLLVCAGQDQVWSSCPYAQAINAELTAAHGPWPHPLYQYPAADHLLETLVPYEPLNDPQGSYPADEQAFTSLWPHLLQFLAS